MIERWVKDYKEPSNKESHSPDKALIDAVLRENHISPDIFKQSQNTFAQLYPLILYGCEKQMINSPDDERIKSAIGFTAKLAISFGDANAAIEYLKRFESTLEKNLNRMIIHDACLFTIPEGNEWTLKLWQAIVNINAPTSPADLIMRLLPRAKNIETYVEEHKPKLIKAIQETVAQEYELRLSREYDALQEAKMGNKEKWINEKMPNTSAIKKQVQFQFEIYLKKQLNVPEKDKLNKEILVNRLKNKTPEDQAELSQLTLRIENEHRERLNEEYKKTLLLGTVDKQKFIEDKLSKAADTIRAMTEDRVRSQLLSLGTPVTTLFDYASEKLYARAKENPEAAMVFFNNSMSEERFNEYLDLPKNDDYAKIPEVTIDGGWISPEYKNYVIMKLPKTDPRYAVLGKLTSCCQSLGDQGQIPAIYSITESSCGAYVLIDKTKIQNGKQGAIVSQCFAWRGHNEALVFDSIETQVNFLTHHENVVINLFTYLAYKLVAIHKAPSVLVGSGGATPKYIGQSKLINEPAKMEGYTVLGERFKQYNDSYKQRIIAKQGEVCLEEYKFQPYKLPDDCNPNQPDANGQTLLHLMAETWNPAGVKAAMEKGADIRLTDKNGKTPLMLALQHKNWNMIDFILRANQLKRVDKSLLNEILISAAKDKYQTSFIIWMINTLKIDINATNSNGETLLHLVAPRANNEVINFLLDNGANINAIDNYGASPLFFALRGKNEKAAKTLIEKGADEKNDTVVLYNSYSKWTGDNAMLTLLQQGNINPNLKLADEHTPLIATLVKMPEFSKEHEKLFEQRVKATQVAVDNPESQVYLNALANEKKWDHMKEILPAKTPPPFLTAASNDAILQVARGEQYELLDRMLAGRQENILDIPLLTELISVATKNQNMELVKKLLAQPLAAESIDGNIRVKNPLSIACKAGNFPLVKLLVEHGATINRSKFSIMGSPIQLAIESNNLELTKYLVEKGADLNVWRTSDSFSEKTPLLNDAVKSASCEIVKYIISKGAETDNLNSLLIDLCSNKKEGANILHFLMTKYKNKLNLQVTDTRDDNLLHIAARSGNTDLIKPLIELGLPLENKKNRSTFTPLQLAIWGETISEETVNALIAAGADVNANSADMTPLSLAVEKGHLPLIKILLKAGADPNPYPDNSSVSILDGLKGFLSLDQVEKLETTLTIAKILLDAGANPVIFQTALKRLDPDTFRSTQPQAAVLYDEVMQRLNDYDNKAKPVSLVNNSGFFTAPTPKESSVNTDITPSPTSGKK